MKKDEVRVVKVKVLVDTAWKKDPVKAGATLEVPESALEQNPTIFERLPDEPAKVPGESKSK